MEDADDGAAAGPDAARTADGLSQPRGRRALALGCAAVLVLALVARGSAAAYKSLVLDEFHTWFHATRPSVDSFFETLRLDNHPPLGFATVAAARALFGTSELALRAPAVLFGLLELALVAWFGARVLGRWPGLAAAALLAASSLHVDFSSQARMYALHSLAATVTLVAGHALLTRPRARAAAFALAVALAVAFHTHYFGGHYVLLYGLAALVAAMADEDVRGRLVRLVLPTVCAAVVCLPWAFDGFRAQLAHRLPPGGDDVSLVGLGEAFIHLFFLNVRLGGEALRIAFIGAGVVVFALGVAGAVGLVRDRERRTLGLLLATGAFGVPTFAWGLANLASRAGFTWHYVLPSAVPLALLAAEGARGARLRVARRAAWGAAFVLAALLTALNVRTVGTEDFRGAVGHALSLYRPGDAVVSVEWQPPLFPQGQPYDYYAPRLVPEPPPRLPCAAYTLVDPGALEGAARVIVVRKSLPADQHLWTLLREHFQRIDIRDFGFALDVSVWERRAP